MSQQHQYQPRQKQQQQQGQQHQNQPSSNSKSNCGHYPPLTDDFSIITRPSRESVLQRLSEALLRRSLQKVWKL
jgi:hypothetical protein